MTALNERKADGKMQPPTSRYLIISRKQSTGIKLRITRQTKFQKFLFGLFKIIFGVIIDIFRPPKFLSAFLDQHSDSLVCI